MKLDQRETDDASDKCGSPMTPGFSVCPDYIIHAREVEVGALSCEWLSTAFRQLMINLSGLRNNGINSKFHQLVPCTRLTNLSHKYGKRIPKNARNWTSNHILNSAFVSLSFSGSRCLLRNITSQFSQFLKSRNWIPTPLLLVFKLSYPRFQILLVQY